MLRKEAVELILDEIAQKDKALEQAKVALESTLTWMDETGACDDEFAFGEPIYGDVREFDTKALSAIDKVLGGNGENG